MARNTGDGPALGRHDLPKGVKHVAVDLQAGEDVKTALQHADITDVFITARMRQPTRRSRTAA